jgi:hypothetical protein
MRMRIAVAVMLVCAPVLGIADIVELSPNLYLVIRDRSRREEQSDYKIAVIDEANRFAASQKKVVAPIGSRLTWLGTYLKEFEYQFRLMSREEALAAKPTLADVVVAVNGINTCGERAAPAVAMLMPELSKLEVMRDRSVLAGNEPKDEEEAPAPAPIPEVPPPLPAPSAQ